jgi:hypothetical protein
MRQPVVPSLQDQFAGFQIERQPDAQKLRWIGIVCRRHRQQIEQHRVAALRLLHLREIGHELFDGAVMFCQRIQRQRKLGEIGKVKRHVAGMAGNGRPDIRPAHAMGDGAESAGGFAEHASLPRSAAANLPLDERYHLIDKKILIAAQGGAVDVLVAAEPREAIGECNHHRTHLSFANQPVEAFRNVFGKGPPIGMRRAGSGVADQIHQQRQFLRRCKAGR